MGIQAQYKELFSAAVTYGRRITPRKHNFRPIFYPQYSNMLMKPQNREDEHNSIQNRVYGDRSPLEIGLWWKAICSKNVSLKATVRNWGRRRVEEAFRFALNDRGFDAKGRALTRQDRYGELREDLTGTLLMPCNEDVLTANSYQLRSDAIMLVDGLMSARWLDAAREYTKPPAEAARGFKRVQIRPTPIHEADCWS